MHATGFRPRKSIASLPDRRLQESVTTLPDVGRRGKMVPLPFRPSHKQRIVSLEDPRVKALTKRPTRTR